MVEIMIKYQQRFIAENHIVYRNAIDDLDVKEFSKSWVENILKILLTYPGIEVYRI